MSCHCHGQSCGCGTHGHSCHSMQGGSCCGSGKSSCSCQSSGGGSCGHSSCGCQHHSCGGGGCKEHAHKLLCIADLAWMEVLKEKMKEHIRANDHHIDELAKVVCEVNRERWQNKMSEERCSQCYEDKLKKMIGEQCHVGKQQGQTGSSQQENMNKNQGF